VDGLSSEAWRRAAARLPHGELRGKSIPERLLHVVRLTDDEGNVGPGFKLPGDPVLDLSADDAAEALGNALSWLANV
jgi:hypothetical protein